MLPIPVAVAKGFTSDAEQTGRPPAVRGGPGVGAVGRAVDVRLSLRRPWVPGPGAAVDIDEAGEVNDFTVRVE